MTVSVTLLCWAYLLGIGSASSRDHGKYTGDSNRVTAQKFFAFAYRDVSVNLHNYFQNSNPMKIGSALHHFFELKADPKRSHALQQVTNTAFEMLTKYAELTERSQLEPEYRVGEKFADLIITPDVRSPRNILVVEYKYISSQDNNYYEKTVLPKAENQLKGYATNLVKRGFKVNGMYLVAAKQMEKKVVVILYGVD
jgi:hypothetical protein